MIQRINQVKGFIILTLNLKPNTTGKSHGVIGYDPYYFRQDSDKRKFDIDERLTGPLPKIEENEVINKVGVYQWQKK